MFADPAVVTINSVAFNLVRINQDKYSSEYLLRASTAEIGLAIRHSKYTDRKRGVSIDRHNCELVSTSYAVAPSTTDLVRKVYFVIENQQGDDLPTCVDTAMGLFDFFTEANITKLLNWES